MDDDATLLGWGSPPVSRTSGPNDPITGDRIHTRWFRADSVQVVGTDIHRAALVDAVPLMLVVLDAHGRITDCNRATIDFVGRSTVDDLAGLPLATLFPGLVLTPDTLDEFVDGTGSAGEVEYVRQDGSTVFLDVVAFRGQPPAANQVFVLLDDITEKINQLSELTMRITALEQMALTDVVTQLPNRLAYELRLGEREEGQPGGWLVLLDINDFKRLNDTFGHPGGDFVLQKMAERLRDAVGPGNHLSRIGGDEFALFLPSRLAQNEVAGRIAYIRGQVARPYEVSSYKIRSNCAYGAAHCGWWMTNEEWVAAADAALYESKDRDDREVTIRKKRELPPEDSETEAVAEAQH